LTFINKTWQSVNIYFSIDFHYKICQSVKSLCSISIDTFTSKEQILEGWCQTQVYNPIKKTTINQSFKWMMFSILLIVTYIIDSQIKPLDCKLAVVWIPAKYFHLYQNKYKLWQANFSKRTWWFPMIKMFRMLFYEIV
jgi:hypothetical protein